MAIAPQPGKSAQRARGRLDEDVLPLEMPPSNFLPRRFGVRGMLVLVTLAFNFLGEWLRDLADPNWKSAARRPRVQR